MQSVGGFDILLNNASAKWMLTNTEAFYISLLQIIFFQYLPVHLSTPSQKTSWINYWVFMVIGVSSYTTDQSPSNVPSGLGSDLNWYIFKIISNTPRSGSIGKVTSSTRPFGPSLSLYTSTEGESIYWSKYDGPCYIRGRHAEHLSFDVLSPTELNIEEYFSSRQHYLGLFVSLWEIRFSAVSWF